MIPSLNKLHELIEQARSEGNLSVVREVTIRAAALKLLGDLSAKAPERLPALEDHVSTYDYTTIDAHNLARCALGLDPEDEAPLTADQMTAVYGVPDATTGEAALFGHDLLLFRALTNQGLADSRALNRLPA